MDHRLIALLLLLAIPSCDIEAQTIINFTTPDTPEGLAVEPNGTLLASMAMTGEIVRVDPRDGSRETLAFIPLGQCQPNPLPPFIAGIAVGEDGNAYVSANTCDPDLRGIWKIDTQSGQASVHATVPAQVVLNGLAIHEGTIYAADSVSGDIYSVPVAGGSARVEFSDPLLAPTGVVVQGMMLPGSNGLQWFEDWLYVSNSSSGDILRIPFDGGPVEVHANVPTGCDDFAVDALGTLLCGTDAFHTILAIFPNGGYRVVLDADDGLDGPTSAVFGPRFGDPVLGEDYYTVYVANAAFPNFVGTGHGPSLVAVDWPAPGAPR